MPLCCLRWFPLILPPYGLVFCFSSAVINSFMRRGTKIESFAHGETRYVKRKLLPWEGWMWEAQLSKVRTEVG